MAPEHLTALKDPVARLITEACQQFVLPRFRALDADQIQSKTSANDLVTIADIEAEAWLGPQLMEVLPGSVALGEEAVSRGEIDQAILHHAAPVWAIDPVDGTYNFAHGREEFCCMVALIQGRKVQAAWIYFPTEDRLFWAGKGLGTFRRDPDGQETKLLISNPKELGAVTNRFFWRPNLKDKKADILKALEPTHPTRCAGMDYRRACEGGYGFVAMANLTPWDHAPGSLLVVEAGGEARLNGAAYDPTISQGTFIAGGHKERLLKAEALLSQ